MMPNQIKNPALGGRGFQEQTSFSLMYSGYSTVAEADTVVVAETCTEARVVAFI